MRTGYNRFILLFTGIIFIWSCNSEPIFIPTVRITDVYESEETLTQIYFTNASTGIAIGENGTFLRTTDGGESWQQMHVPDDNVDFNCISFPDPFNGYVSGTPNTIMKTTDGGNTWSVLDSIKTMDFTSFPTVGTGYLMRNGYLSKTTNGGISWMSTGFDYTNGAYDPINMHFYTQYDGFVVNSDFDHEVTFTHNGGNSWSYVAEYSNIGHARLFRHYGDISYWAIGYSTYYSGLFYMDMATGLIHHYSTEGFTTGNNSYMQTMHTVDGTHYIMCGPSCCALSNDGGESWTEVFDENGKNFTLDDAAAMQQGRYAGIYENHIYLLTQDN